ncbi:MAG: type II secretion system F family protein [Gammaproteobacteria bacterium]|nr:type II secretion system F family protein [Gammaproteobacteria bacterium]
MNQKISDQNIATFFENLSNLLTSGIPLLQALEMITAITPQNNPIRALLKIIISDIKNGHTFVQALKKHDGFDRTTCELIHIGEQSGKLEIVLARIAKQFEKIIGFKKNLKKILFYPITTLFIATIVTTILLIFVIPQFERLFQDFGHQLPGLTRFIIQLSHAFRDNYLYFILFFLLLFLILISVKEAPAHLRIYYDDFLLKIPFYTSFLKKTFFERFAENLNLALDSGIPLLSALDLNAKISENLILQKHIKNIQTCINQGLSLRTSLEQTDFFPELFIQMVAIGEESGTLTEMLGKCTAWYEKELAQLISSFSQWIEPFTIVILGIIIGTLVIGMYLPIFKLGTVI